MRYIRVIRISRVIRLTAFIGVIRISRVIRVTALIRDMRDTRFIRIICDKTPWVCGDEKRSPEKR